MQPLSWLPTYFANKKQGPLDPVYEYLSPPLWQTYSPEVALSLSIDPTPLGPSLGTWSATQFYLMRTWDSTSTNWCSWSQMALACRAPGAVFSSWTRQGLVHVTIISHGGKSWIKKQALQPSTFPFQWNPRETGIANGNRIEWKGNLTQLIRQVVTKKKLR